MVVFTCNNCGDSLQKPKVAKHYQFACRSQVFLTCVDCHKDFRGNDYVSHTKCITENERYGGKDYIQKPSANKGEKKQQAWISVVQNVIADSKSLTIPERNLLNSIANHENIPRKKAKFINFIKNISKNRVQNDCIESVWLKMEKAFKEAAANEKTIVNNNENKTSNSKEPQVNLTTDLVKKSDNIGNINNGDDQQNQNEKEGKKHKKSKKRPNEVDENDNDQPASKRKNNTEENDCQKTDSNNQEVDIFSWKNTILEIVTAKTDISIKKLRKKVLARYQANFPDESLEKATLKFDKKLKKLSNILIEDDKVKLASF